MEGGERCARPQGAIWILGRCTGLELGKLEPKGKKASRGVVRTTQGPHGCSGQHGYRHVLMEVLGWASWSLREDVWEVASLHSFRHFIKHAFRT